MKKLVLTTLLLTSGAAFAACPTSPLEYSLTGKAEGTLSKSYSCDDGSMTIKSEIKVSKFFHDISIDQTVTGQLAADGAFTATSTTTKDSRHDDGKPVTVQLTDGTQDTLSLVYLLGNSLNNNTAIPDTINVARNGGMQLFHCIKSDEENDAFKFDCKNHRNGQLVYVFSKVNDKFTMVQSDIVNNGSRVFLAKLKS